jgi:DNA helicase-2/ATP-dependent DNA helicase PcrA
MSRGLTVLPLTVTRRCPKTHVALVQDVVPEFVAAPEAPQGSIEYVNMAEAISRIEQGDLVQCRNNAPLASFCWKLLKRGLKVAIAGKQVGDGLIALIKRLKAKSLEELISKIEGYREREAAKCEKMRNGEAAKAALDDKCDAIIFLSEGLDSVPALIALITSIFDDFDETGCPKAAVLLSTVHKAKGLEADNVWILDPSLMPAKWAKQAWELEQEQNLIYVARTRSKNLLGFISVDK